MQITAYTGAEQQEQEYAFGAFRLIPPRQLLLRDDEPLRIGARALDILTLLIRKQGQLASRRELMAYAWPRTVVEDSNLKVQVAILRRLLGDGKEGDRYIATVSGRGYRFVAPVDSRNCIVLDAAPRIPIPPLAAAAAETAVAAANTSAIAMPDAAPRHNLPTSHSRLIGRDVTLAALLQMLRQERFISIVGPAGVGKSVVALAAAESYGNEASMPVCLVNLGTLSDERLLLDSVASQLGLPPLAGAGLPGLAASLRGRSLLLVLDGCDHVIDGVAVLIEQLVCGMPGIRVLATSREPLSSAGEHVYRLPPLAYPPQGVTLNAAQAQAYPAAQLFAERAAERLAGYRLSDADAPAVIDICQRLEGLALAIEIAAMRIDALGPRETAARLSERWQLLHWSRRSTHPCHSTLSTALDWSYEFLDADEQRLLRTLAVFASSFTLEAAIGLCRDDKLDVVDSIASLVTKSLLLANINGPVAEYRLLETTRAYALEKLDHAGALPAMQRRHAGFFCHALTSTARAQKTDPRLDWCDIHLHDVDDIHAALAWAFSPEGDAALGVQLAAAAAPLWLHLSMHEECRPWLELALARGAGDERTTALLHAAQASASAPQVSPRMRQIA